MNPADPQFHQSAERRLIEHVERLLASPNFRVDTTAGLKATSAYVCDVTRGDGAVDLKRAMADAGKPDRDLQGKMPAGQTLTATLSKKKWGLFKQPVGTVRVVCQSPTRALLRDEAGEPTTSQDVQAILSAQPQSAVPVTVIILSTAGFAQSAKDQIDRRTDRTVLLVEPNAAGGWNAYGPPTLKATVDQLNPEADEEKRSRVAEQIKSAEMDLSRGGLSADKIAARTQLPLQWVEAELKQHAKSRPGLSAKRLDGHLVLFREGSLPPAPAASRAGGFEMPFMESVKSLFSRKGEMEKKIALLSERRAQLSQRRDSAHETMASLESEEVKLRDEFKDSTSESTRKRLTSQLLQAKKELSRRQQLLSVLNQQIDVISSHLHALELTQQGRAAKLPDSADLARDAEAAEDVMAQLQADRELANSLLPSDGPSLTDEEQELYEALSAEMTPKRSADASPAAAIPQSSSPMQSPGAAPGPAMTDPAAPRTREQAS